MDLLHLSSVSPPLRLICASLRSLSCLRIQCLESLPAGQYEMLAVLLYIGPLFFLFIAHVFIVAVLIYAFVPLKATVKDVRSLSRDLS